MMSKVFSEKNKTGEKLIILLAWISLLLVIWSVFIVQRWYFVGSNGLFMDIFKVAPYVLFSIYMSAFYKKLKATVMVPIIFGIVTLNGLYDIVSPHISIGLFLVGILFFILCIFVTINTFKGMEKKGFILFTLIIGVFKEVWQLKLYDFLVNSFIWIEAVAAILFYIVLMIFAVKCKIPQVMSAPERKEVQVENGSTAEKDLRELNDKLKSGAITKVEYERRRAEIVKRL